MTTDSTDVGPPSSVRRVESPAATELALQCATFEDLQTVLRCCEVLVATLAGGPGRATEAAADQVVTEAAWTTALLSYARCFRTGPLDRTAGLLTEDDVTGTQAGARGLEWHRAFLRLRDHYADRRANPREQFSVGVAQDASGAARGVAVTSVRQPLVDELTVRQLGGLAFALSTLVDGRIGEGQERLFASLQEMSPAALDALAPLDVALSDAPQ
jgi:hypothetical protein